MARIRIIAYVLLIGGVVAAFMRLLPARDDSRVIARERRPDGHQAVHLLSASYHLDRVYLSMTGPRSNQSGIRISEDVADDETVWLTGLETVVVDSRSLERISDEFVCHTNLTLNPETTNPDRHNASFDVPHHNEWRFFTLVPGRTSIQLPEGFGIPVKNSTLLDYFTMALNQNPADPNLQVRLKTHINYRTDTGNTQPLRPLFRRALYIYQQYRQSSDGHSGGIASPQSHRGEECAESTPVEQIGATPSTFAAGAVDKLDHHPGATCCVANASPDGIVEQFGDVNTVHWMVPPGRHRFRTEVTQQMNLPFDTTAHYVTGHLHPFGKSIELVDMETGEVVFRITSKNREDRLGVEFISEIHSGVGIPIYQGRRYELVSDYDNSTSQPIDAMAILYIYALDVDPSVRSRT